MCLPCVCACVCVPCVHVYVPCVCMYMCMCVCACVCMCLCMCACVCAPCVCICMCLAYVCLACVCVRVSCVYVCLCVCTQQIVFDSESGTMIYSVDISTERKQSPDEDIHLCFGQSLEFTWKQALLWPSTAHTRGDSPALNKHAGKNKDTECCGYRPNVLRSDSLCDLGLACSDSEALVTRGVDMARTRAPFNTGRSLGTFGQQLSMCLVTLRCHNNASCWTVYNWWLMHSLLFSKYYSSSLNLNISKVIFTLLKTGKKYRIWQLSFNLMLWKPLLSCYHNLESDSLPAGNSSQGYFQDPSFPLPGSDLKYVQKPCDASF